MRLRHLDVFIAVIREGTATGAAEVLNTTTNRTEDIGVSARAGGNEGLMLTTDENIVAGLGRFGPFVRRGKTFASLKSNDDMWTVTLEEDADAGQPGRVWGGRGAAHPEAA